MTSLWDALATPALLTDPDTAAVQLGVKFQANVDGAITGIRFYKGPQNTGTHVGNLWTATGCSATPMPITAWHQIQCAIRDGTRMGQLSRTACYDYKTSKRNVEKTFCCLM